MRYKIVVTCPEYSTAKKIYELISTSKVYKSEEIVSLHGIKEVCDECLKNI